jgi:hypothetical protein
LAWTLDPTPALQAGVAALSALDGPGLLAAPAEVLAALGPGVAGVLARAGPGFEPALVSKLAQAAAAAGVALTDYAALAAFPWTTAMAAPPSRELTVEAYERAAVAERVHMVLAGLGGADLGALLASEFCADHVALLLHVALAGLASSCLQLTCSFVFG